jgi:hypothetical protein
MFRDHESWSLKRSDLKGFALGRPQRIEVNAPHTKAFFAPEVVDRLSIRDHRGLSSRCLPSVIESGAASCRYGVDGGMQQVLSR